MVGLREIRKKRNLNQQRVALDLNITRCWFRFICIQSNLSKRKIRIS